ncbi:glycosyltransferase family 4 protein [Acinetobacter lanii]|uniref:Glycosyltransferase family 4 protein n=1 Tax=Acinetobacter lanii TaxID=2715163 RepID=A0A6G8S7T1_9GAMM|nr:glycosyltransferase family 4 protein [Acinetobacter lanii]QIO10184.1 glycosyltransferase family 4 protein [Acinetobacter lanii]
MSHKKIIIIGTTASNLFLFRKDLITSCQKNNIQVHAFVSEYNDQWIARIQSLGAEVVTYHLSRGGLNPLEDIQSVRELVEKIRIIKPDLVFSYSSKPVIYGSIAAKLAKVPQVIGMLEGLGYTFTEQPDGQSFKTKIIRNIQVLLYRLAFPCLDKIIFLNPDDPQDLINKYRIKAKDVENLGATGLSLKDYPYSTAPTHPVKFLFIGRLLKEKGIYELIEAMRLVKAQYPQAHFTVLGEIDKENLGALKQQQLNELVHEKLFEYPGYVTNIKDWITDSSVFVLPSYREGVPRSTQEAMAIGRPVITTDVPGCRETVVDGLNGFLIPKWNPQALAQKMCYFIEHPKKINEMGLQSFKIAQERFDAEKINRKLLKIIGLVSENEEIS